MFCDLLNQREAVRSGRRVGDVGEETAVADRRYHRGELITGLLVTTGRGADRKVCDVQWKLAVRGDVEEVLLLAESKVFDDN